MSALSVPVDVVVRHDVPAARLLPTGPSSSRSGPCAPTWSTESLLVDGRSPGEVRQGVTTQIMGEGWSMGPLNDAMKKRMKDDQGDLKFDVVWTTPAEYLAHLEAFLAAERSVAATSDRAACRLSGPRLEHEGASEITSDSMVPGSIQVPPDGQPIVMLADVPTTGG